MHYPVGNHYLALEYSRDRPDTRFHTHSHILHLLPWYDSHKQDDQFLVRITSDMLTTRVGEVFFMLFITQPNKIFYILYFCTPLCTVPLALTCNSFLHPFPPQTNFEKLQQQLCYIWFIHSYTAKLVWYNMSCKIIIAILSHYIWEVMQFIQICCSLHQPLPSPICWPFRPFWWLPLRRAIFFTNLTIITLLLCFKFANRYPGSIWIRYDICQMVIIE